MSEHQTTKARSPRTTGFVERMDPTLLDECFRIEGAKLGAWLRGRASA